MTEFCSILDTDLYKFSTSYAYMKMFPEAEGTFSFIDRNKVKRTNEFLSRLKDYLEKACNVRLSNIEKEWCIKNIPYIPAFYWEWLQSFQYEMDKMALYLDAHGVLHVEVTDKLYKSTLYEILILSSINEVEHDDDIVDWEFIDNKLFDKIRIANKNNVKFSEFGTRRRFSHDVQDYIIYKLEQMAYTCVGTSNVYFAMMYDMKPIGTHPHEWFMFHGAIYGAQQANYLALENWVNVYDGDLGIALTDTYGTNAFFNQMSLKQAKLFDGLRQDSGDEYEFANKAMQFYIDKGIDYKSKSIVFSNSLDFPKALKIKQWCDTKSINCSFGIGTNLTNDCGYPAENIVMKLFRCRMNSSKDWRNCCKLSDDKGKESGLAVDLVKQELYGTNN